MQFDADRSECVEWSLVQIPLDENVPTLYIRCGCLSHLALQWVAVCLEMKEIMVIGNQRAVQINNVLIIVNEKCNNLIIMG